MDSSFEDDFEDKFFETVLDIAVNNKKMTQKDFGMAVFGHERGLYPSSSSGKRQRITLAQAIKMASVVGLDFIDLFDMVSAKLQRIKKK